MGESAGGYDLGLIFEGHHDASGIQKMKSPPAVGAVTEEPFQSNPRVRALPPYESHVGPVQKFLQ
jgi:hypothetical protein